MKRLLALFLLACFSAFGVDTIPVGTPQGYTTVYTYDWTSDGSGNATGRTADEVPGIIQTIATMPSASAAPTDNYDVVITQAFTNTAGTTAVIGSDLLAGLGANRDTANNETTDIWPSTLINIRGKLQIEITNAGSAKSGRVQVFVYRTLAVVSSGGNFGVPVGGATTQLLQWSSNSQAKWVTMSGEATIADGGALDITNVSLADLGTDPVGRLKFGNSSDFYAGYDGTNNVLAVYEGVGGDERFIINDTASSSDEPFSFGFGKDWATWESWNGALSHYERLHNWHFFSPSEVDAVMEIESGGDTTLTIEAGANGGAAKSGYIAWQRGNASNTWSLGSKGSDSDAFVLDDAFGLGVNPVLHIARSGYLMTYAGSMDTKDVYNDDVSTTLTNLSATIGGFVTAPNKNIATLTAAGNASARVQLDDLGGTADQHINELITDDNLIKITRRTNAGASTSQLEISNATDLATFTGSIDGKDFYNNDATPTLATLSATVGGIQIAPNKNIATFTAAGNTSARLHLEDIGGTTNRKIMEITMDGETSSWVRRVDAGTSTTMLSFAHADSAATFAANASINGNTTLGDASTDTITSNGRLSIRSVTDAGPMTATAGTARELVWNTSDSKVYVCTATGSPATWAALN